MEGKTVSLPVWSICPFRSPVGLPEDSVLKRANGDPVQPTAPRQSLGPCLYAGCALFKITKVVDGQVKDGMCSIRFLAESANPIAGALERIASLASLAAQQAGILVDHDKPTTPAS